MKLAWEVNISCKMKKLWTKVKRKFCSTKKTAKKFPKRLKENKKHPIQKTNTYLNYKLEKIYEVKSW